MKCFKKQITCFLAAGSILAAPYLCAQAPFVDESEERAFVHEEISDNQTLSRDAEILNKIQGLQQEIQELRGQLELQHHQLELLQQRPVQANKEMNVSISPVMNPEGEKMAYQSAYDLILSRQYDEAMPAMQSFVKTYPKGGYAANAHYWLGELYMVQKNYSQAIQEFELVVHEFPSSSKVSASLLKRGYAFAASGDRQGAKASLQSVVKQYPDTHAAQLALAKLDSINQQ